MLPVGGEEKLEVGKSERFLGTGADNHHQPPGPSVSLQFTNEINFDISSSRYIILDIPELLAFERHNRGLKCPILTLKNRHGRSSV